MQINVSFVKEKDTKNTVRFKEVVAPGATAVIGTLYIDKAKVGTATQATVAIVLG